MADGKLTNKVGGEIKKMRALEFFGAFDEDAYGALRERAKVPNTDYLVLFRNLMFDSSQFGATAAAPVGAAWSMKNLEEISRVQLGDTPSTFKYPVGYIAADELLEEGGPDVGGT